MGLKFMDYEFEHEMFQLHLHLIAKIAQIAILEFIATLVISIIIFRASAIRS